MKHSIYNEKHYKEAKRQKSVMFNKLCDPILQYSKDLSNFTNTFP